MSVSENVDETPSGQLVHGIFSAVSEWYSLNLAQEVVKGMEEKVRNGGTLGRAPAGYVNIRELINGREARTIGIDVERADHIRWAFRSYADDPDMTVTTLTELLRDRGLTQRATAKQPERPLIRSNVHRMLTNTFYIGQVTWRGVEHTGTHEPLVDAQTFNRVQERLATNRAGGNRERKHQNYLSGSLFCARCKSRMLYMVTTGKSGGRYEYYACSGRHTKSNACQAPFVSLDKVEEAVSSVWASEHGQWQHKAVPVIRRRLQESLASLRREAVANTGGLKRRIDQINMDRKKWAEHVFNGTVPADIARDKQDALTRQLASLEHEITTFERAQADTEGTLDAVLDLIADPRRMYTAVSDPDRRRYNQAWFTRIYIDSVEDDDADRATKVTEVERTPFSESLDGVRQLVTQQDNKKRTPQGPFPSRAPTLAGRGFE